MPGTSSALTLKCKDVQITADYSSWDYGSPTYQEQGWQVCDEAVITAGKNMVITGSSQTTRVVTNCHKPSQTPKQYLKCD